MRKNSAFSLIELSIVILIVGVLIAGLVKGAALLKAMKLSTARSITRTSDIASIKDLVLWVDATAENVLANSIGSKELSNGDKIKTLLDQNPQVLNRVTFTQATAGNQPTYVDDGINGLPTIYFDTNASGTTAQFLAAPYSILLNPTQFTVFAVAQPIEATTNWGAIFMSRHTSLPFYGYNLYKNQTQPNWEFWTGTGGAWTSVIDTSFSFKTSYILTGLRDATTTTIFRNGTQKATSTAVYIPNVDSSSSFLIGAANSSTFPFDGYISELILFERALSVDERKSVEKYLGKKYAITVN